MKWMARVFAFAAALFVGTLAASLVLGPDSGLSNCTVPFAPAPPAVAPRVPVRVENLLGTWKGTWGHNDGEATIAIDHVDGDAFYGTLKKQGAVIRFEGTFDPRTRTFRFDETEVVRLGASMTEWSLGKNSGIISHDGRILAGDGYDKWGQYAWAASNY